MFNSGINLIRGSATPSPDMPPLPQCLPLDPIILGSQKYTRSGELRRLLGVPPGSTSEDHSFGVAHPKPPPPVATEELKHIKESVQDASKKARDRAKLLRESILKLDKYRDALSSKKRQRSDLSSSERSSGVKLAKMGSQVHRNSNDSVSQRLEDKTKSIGINKRVRTSVADERADGRPAATSRQQMVTEKDGDLLQAVSGVSVRIEEKTRRLLAGGEGLDKKVKKKRSVGAVGNRVVTGERDTKRAVHPKLNLDSKLRSCDTHGFRLKSSPGVSGINKVDGSFEATCSDACAVVRNELEHALLPRDRTVVLEQRLLAKGNNKSNIQEDIPAGHPNTMVKGKVSRAPRTGSVMGLDSSPNVYHSTGAIQGWEQSTGLHKVPVVRVTNNQRRTISSGSSIHPMTQWVGQRPHKNSRTRRANLVSPVSNHAESQISSQSLTSTDFSAKTSSLGTSASLLAGSVDNSTLKVKREPENVSSPFGLSESEESGVGETKLREKGIDNGNVPLVATHKAGIFVLPTKKNKMPGNETGEGVQRQGRSGTGSSLIKPGIPSSGEKLDNLSMTKPLQTMRPSSEKNKSKSGRPPSKKLKDRKASIRVGPIINNGSSNVTGESDDDRGELFAAANAACNASSLACSGPFWNEMESMFSFVSSEDLSYLKQQLSFAEELDENLSQMFGVVYDNVLGVGIFKEASDCSGIRQRSHSHQESVETDSIHGRFDSRKWDRVTPLYQRVLSALIEEDESEEFYHQNEGKTLSLQYASDDSHCGSCNQVDIEPKDCDRMESEAESRVDSQTQRNYLLDRLPCDKSVTSNSFRNPSNASSFHSIEQWRGNDDFSHSDLGHTSEICSNDLGQLQPGELNAGSLSSNCQYQRLSLDDKLLLELQSIGLYPETLPNLAEGEVINQDIMELKEGLYRQIGRKMKNLVRIDEAIQKGGDVKRRKMEEVAMDQLIEMAYRKRLACRGSSATKSAVRKVSKQVALALIKRTLVRCRKFEHTGTGCFSERALQDVILSVPPGNNDAKSIDCVGSGTASNTCNEASHQAEPRGLGAVSSASERYDSLSDNIDRGSSDALQSLIQSSEQASSKRSSVFIKGKKREMLIDDVVGSASSRVTSALDSTAHGGLKGKRSEREGDQKGDTLRSNSISGVSHSSLGSFGSERKTKAKPKQKNNHLLVEAACPPVRGSSQPVALVGNKVSREAGSFLPTNATRESSKEADEPVPLNLQPNELDSMEVLGVDGHQDFSSWLDFDEDGLQDLDSIGLEIPMDDLSDLKMLI
ncbi:hypothetical protein I3843_14G101200 [Carya illinoinensis]|nr:hypothetical protein I3843_14G101200 [Carya illinoinensis]KAG7947562.1 hypothetical protein I3843_14G101200 [Carya illinoinensis]KAG7947563.1 hypothetical protein I3843_14G101200 [Carya illinoinensis]KAG7947564.1 hypothetical protein I3843_14G101200 [Carya illinoinensis]